MTPYNSVTRSWILYMILYLRLTDYNFTQDAKSVVRITVHCNDMKKLHRSNKFKEFTDFVYSKEDKLWEIFTWNSTYKTMNFTSICRTHFGSISHLIHEHRAVLTVLDVLILLGNTVANTLVIYVLIKTKEITKFSCKLLCLLSVNDLAIASIAQTLFITEIYGASCVTNLTYQLVSRFLPRLSGYTIGVIGIDRYVRIRYKMNFKSILTTKLLIILMVLIFLIALTQVGLITLGILLHKKTIFSNTVLGIDIFLFICVVYLQIGTIKTTSSTQKKASNPEVLKDVNKKITKLCTRIMISYITFYLPYMIINCVRNKMHGTVSLETKSLLDFLFMVSIIIVYFNSLVNALLFLSSNVKARQFLKQACTSSENLAYMRKESGITVT